MENWSKSAKVALNIGLVFVVLLISAGIFRGCFFTFVDGHEIGYEFNKQTGNIKVLERTGYFWVVPFSTSVYTIDARPMQVRIEANSRVLNAKLVRFRNTPEGVLQFVRMHGLDDYSGSGSNLADILKSYAYENFSNEAYSKEALEKKYLFLEIQSIGTNATQPSPLQTHDSLKAKE
jgi:hypothetical protein